MFKIFKGDKEAISTLGQLQYKDYLESEPFNGQYPWKLYCFILKDKEKIVTGVNLGATLNPDKKNKVESLFIHNLFVSKDQDYNFRLKEILSKIDALAKTEDINQIWTLTTDEGLVKALLANGFVEFGKLHKAPVKDLVIHHLSKKCSEKNQSSNQCDEDSPLTTGSTEDATWIRNQSTQSFVPWPSHEPSEIITPLCFVAENTSENTKEIVAGISGSFTLQDSFFLHYFFVKKDLRKQGLGSLLLSELIDEIKEFNSEVKVIYCFTINPTAVNLYKQFGFEVYCELVDAPLTKMTTYFLKLNL